jgi:formate dehydrogenase maturation protein FdhE
MIERELCPVCGNNPVAINYVKNHVTHYRASCSACLRKGKKLKPLPPPWAKSGYKKKPQCEKCGFKFRLTEQSNVFYVDGNLKNNNWVNLKTVCLNCQREVYKSQMGWKAGPIVPDF